MPTRRGTNYHYTQTRTTCPINKDEARKTNVATIWSMIPTRRGTNYLSTQTRTTCPINKGEARKMDAARIMSETTVRVRTENDDSNSNDIIMYDWKEMLGIGMTKSVAYPSSELLKSSKVKNVFYSLLISSGKAQKLVKKLLNLEQKSSKWYPKMIPVAFFRYNLARKIERWEKYISISVPLQSWAVKDLISKLRSEISKMETAMYDLSQQVDGPLGLKIPNIFMSAYKDAQKAGHLKDESGEVIVID